MIITKQWLNEWIDISGVSVKRLCEVFNSIGLEVDSLTSYKMPKHVVVGKVEEKDPHPDADKLSVCQVNIGGKIQQIVCGAKNVAKGQLVPVALSGAKLPNGLEIKPTKLRGVQSNGMICSSSELGLPKINDGIMVLDESLGKLKLGMELANIEKLNDDVIDLELTANRGDCLSIHGVARDLSAYLGKNLKELPHIEEDEHLLGIGRILSLQIEDRVDSSFVYKALEYSSFKENVLMQIRLGLVEFEYKNPIECFLNYTTYSTGVLFRAYDFDLFAKGEKAEVVVKKTKEGFDGVFDLDGLASYVGYKQDKCSKITNKPKRFIIEASYVRPEIISRLGMKNKKINSDFHYYRSSRGSEPDLEFGMKCLRYVLKEEDGISLYGGSQKHLCDLKEKSISFSLDSAVALIGEKIDKNKSINLLKALGFDVTFNTDQDMFYIKVPPYRHDVSDMQDICEEIVRIIGIDNITPKSYKFAEKSRENKAYLDFKKRYDLRQKSVGAGFFESISYVFDDKAKMDKYSIQAVDSKIDIANPITNELNTLRSTLCLHLLDAVSLNVKNSMQNVCLFEIGKVFNQKREESTKIAWVMSGQNEGLRVENHGKLPLVSLERFAYKISSILGKFSLEAGKSDSKLFSPYEYANVLIDGKVVGFMARVHAKVEDEYGILNTYICELDFDKLPRDEKIAKAYSKFPSSSRELSLLVPQDMQYKKVKECIDAVKEKNLIKFFPIDRFESDDLGDNVSLSVKFIFQDDKQTLEDEQVNKIIDLILKNLDAKLGIKLR
ncbi:MAG: phenylalanine--tRNA ligase subunit beta [Proteobacteria bacterium]|nr:MAG: phenylalanine--tRNA ligase subunit beta [Pseudomonadota bacterium]